MYTGYFSHLKKNKFTRIPMQILNCTVFWFFLIDSVDGWKLEINQKKKKAPTKKLALFTTKPTKYAKICKLKFQIWYHDW